MVTVWPPQNGRDVLALEGCPWQLRMTGVSKHFVYLGRAEFRLVAAGAQNCPCGQRLTPIASLQRARPCRLSRVAVVLTADHAASVIKSERVPTMTVIRRRA